MNGITSEMLKAEGDCVCEMDAFLIAYAFLGINLAFNGDHRDVLEDWKNGSVVQLESHVKRGLLGMFLVQSSVRPVRDAIGCRLALAFRPGSYRVPGGVKGRSLQVPGWYACGWYGGFAPAQNNTRDLDRCLCMTRRLVKAYAKCLLNRMRDAVDGKILFPVAIDWVLGKQQEKRAGVKFADLDFADDIAENARDLQPLVTNIVRLQTALGSASGPSINMLLLEVSTNKKGQMDNELDCRLGKASAAFNQLGFETYYVEISQEEKRLESLDASDSECVRKILSIRRQDFIPNTDI
ncbi:hypothetical protein Bbelb_411280 [Branchiostoma belcheri]|nr:hypothetical protein Bbelb_411280 [Branchiostoma belcheri]